MTVMDPAINQGRPTNIPSLFVEDGVVVQFHNEFDAVKAALDTGLKFPSFDTIDDAVGAASQRSQSGGASTNAPLGKVMRE